MNLDLKALLHFAVVAEERSFTSAAKRLGIAQPWLSQRIRSLEERTGFELFHRQGRKIELTPNGSIMFEAVRGLPAIARDIGDVADQLSLKSRSSLRIGAPPYAGRIAIVNDLLAELGTRYRDANIALEVGWSSHLVERVRQGDLDATFALQPFDSAGLDIVDAGKLVRLFVPAAAGKSANGKAAIEPAELIGRPVAVFPRDVNPELFDLAFAPLIAAGVDLVPVAFDGRPMRAGVAAGDLVPSFFGQRDVSARPEEMTVIGSPEIRFQFVSRVENETPLVRASRELLSADATSRR